MKNARIGCLTFAFYDNFDTEQNTKNLIKIVYLYKTAFNI